MPVVLHELARLGVFLLRWIVCDVVSDSDSGLAFESRRLGFQKLVPVFPVDRAPSAAPLARVASVFQFGELTR